MISVFTNKTTALILVFILLANNINTLTIVGNFVLNQEFIAKTLCVQKAKQQGCNGKCQLVKKLKENSPESNSKTPLQNTKRLSLDVFCIVKPTFIDHLNIGLQNSSDNFNAYSLNLSCTYFDIDTPPPIVI